MICKKTLVLTPTGLEAITEGVDYQILSREESGVYIENNQGDIHHFSPLHLSEYFS